MLSRHFIQEGQGKQTEWKEETYWRQEVASKGFGQCTGLGFEFVMLETKDKDKVGWRENMSSLSVVKLEVWSSRERLFQKRLGNPHLEDLMDAGAWMEWD